jgi:hypothetical protein
MLEIRKRFFERFNNEFKVDVAMREYEFLTELGYAPEQAFYLATGNWQIRIVSKHCGVATAMPREVVFEYYHSPHLWKKFFPVKACSGYLKDYICLLRVADIVDKLRENYGEYIEVPAFYFQDTETGLILEEEPQRQVKLPEFLRNKKRYRKQRVETENE